MDAVLGHMFTSVQYGHPTEPLFPVTHIWPKDEAVAPARTTGVSARETSNATEGRALVCCLGERYAHSVRTSVHDGGR